jgi:hypothetical protein
MEGEEEEGDVSGDNRHPDGEEGAQAQLERVEEVGRCEDDGEDGEHGEPAEVEEEDRGGTSAATRRALWANVVPEAGDEADAAGLAPPPVEERDL